MIDELLVEKRDDRRETKRRSMDKHTDIFAPGPECLRGKRGKLPTFRRSGEMDKPEWSAMAVTALRVRELEQFL